MGLRKMTKIQQAEEAVKQNHIWDMINKGKDHTFIKKIYPDMNSEKITKIVSRKMYAEN